METHCCRNLADATQTLHHDTPPSPDRVIAYDPVFDEYRHVEPPGQLGGEPLRHCPWCGAALPESQRARWFEAVAELGYIPDDPNLPEQFTSSRWHDNPNGR